LTLLRLPYFWDEGGYYIPAAWDFFRTGSLIPITTMRNAHPPLPSILLAGWWKLFGFNILATRLCVCLVAAVALLGVFRLARAHVGRAAAFTTAALTAIYPIWFVQSTLAHADIFAAAFTLWALALYLEPAHASAPNQALRRLAVAALFACAVLAKETAIVTPIALAALEAVLLVRHPAHRRPRLAWLLALAAPALPLAAWYAYHREKTGFAFGNPEFFRYNATANLDAHRILLSLYHRGIHLTAHMNMFVAVVCAVAAILMPAFADRPRLSRPFLAAVAVVLSANTIAFSVLGGALLTRYLLPMYPLVVLLCVAAWQRHLRQWAWLAAFTAAAFLAALWINPPYAFAAEDNLTYRDMIVIHEQAIDLLQSKFPEATVLTAWPGAAELERPELGYTAKTFKVAEIENFSLP
jgi:4-amino-4-deoxy-L-arabinose transferase-like glycosyltransferase